MKIWKQLEIMSGSDASEDIVEATVDPLTTDNVVNVPNMISAIDKVLLLMIAIDFYHLI